MTNRILICSMVLGGLLISAIVAQAVSEPNRLTAAADFESTQGLDTDYRGNRQEHRLEMMITILDLSTDQQQQVEQLISAKSAKHKNTRQERHSSRAALNELMHAQPFDETAFRSLAKQQADQRIDKMVARAKTRQQIFAILTPEQQEKAVELQSLMGNKGKSRHGRGF